jgi:hypothetical protein
MRRSELWALGLCLGVALYVGVIAALPNTASALDLPTPVIEDLGKSAEDFHPPPLHLPHVEVPTSVVAFGTTDAGVVTALEVDETTEDTAVSKEAEDLSTDPEEQDKVKECAEKGLLAILEEGGNDLTYEEAAEKGLAPCFDEFVPEGEQVEAVVEYFKKQEAEQSGKAYADAGENPVVLGNWLRTTAPTVHPVAAPESQPEPQPADNKGGLSSGAIAAIVFVVAVALFFAYRATQRRGRP